MDTTQKYQFNTPSFDGACKSFTFLSMFLLFHFLDSNVIIKTAFKGTDP